MKTAALYGKQVSNEHIPQIKRIINSLFKAELNVYASNAFYNALKALTDIDEVKPYEAFDEISDKVDLFISIGGDGTFLDASKYVVGSRTPIIGFNTGRLGFLSRISNEDLDSVLSDLLKGNFGIEERALIELNSAPSIFEPVNFALNEFTVHKNDTSSMITVNTKLDGEFLNSYWADGLIISTPTGSTAYSMSCGGPIAMPGSNNFIITPVAPHNLNVRPIVIPDTCKIELTVEGRGKNCIVSLDSNIQTFDVKTTFTVTRHKKNLKLITLPGNSYLRTLRNKLNWGLDQRN